MFLNALRTYKQACRTHTRKHWHSLGRGTDYLGFRLFFLRIWLPFFCNCPFFNWKTQTRVKTIRYRQLSLYHWRFHIEHYRYSNNLWSPGSPNPVFPSELTLRSACVTDVFEYASFPDPPWIFVHWCQGEQWSSVQRHIDKI